MQHKSLLLLTCLMLAPLPAQAQSFAQPSDTQIFDAVGSVLSPGSSGSGSSTDSQIFDAVGSILDTGTLDSGSFGSIAGAVFGSNAEFGNSASIGSRFEGIFANVGQGDIGGIFDNVAGLLGDLGILSPGQAGEAVATGQGSGSPIREANTPEAIYQRQRFTTGLQSEIARTYSQSVFGEQGQQTMELQRAGLAEANTNSLSMLSALADVHRDSFNQADVAAQASAAVVRLSDQAQGMQSTHDVLKQVAAQNAFQSELDAALAHQLADTSASQALQGSIAAANNSVLATISAQTQVNQVLNAAQNETTVATNQELVEQGEYEKTKDLMEYKAWNQSRQRVYIPGLISPES